MPTGHQKEISRESMALAAYQLEGLQTAASGSGRLTGLLYYHAVSRDERRLQALKRRALDGHPEDRLVYLLLTAENGSCDTGELLHLGRSAEDPWVVYTLVKFLLGAGHLSEAVATTVSLLGRGVHDTLCLNVIARHALCQGHGDAARRLAERSLAMAPKQRDMRALLACLETGRRVAPPCLNVLPPTYRVAYYLPCYKVEEHIARTIEAVAVQWHPLEEILIIDDGTPDASVAIAQRYPVRVVRHGENRGLAAARNTAWQQSSATFIATVDTDAFPDPRYLTYALMEFEQGPDGLALTGGRLFEAHIDTPADEFRATFMAQDPGNARWYLCAVDGEDVEAGTFVTGSDTVARRSALEAVGGYPERHRTNGEDEAVCARFLRQGLHFAHVPHCTAMHYRRDTCASVLRTAWNYGFWQRSDAGNYANLTTLLQSLEGHAIASQHYLLKSIEEKRLRLLYVEFLYMFTSVRLGLGHGLERGLLRPGQARTVQDAFDQLAVVLDHRFGGALREKVRADLAAFDVGGAAEPEPLGVEEAEQLAAVVRNVQRDYDIYNAPLYQLLLEG